MSSIETGSATEQDIERLLSALEGVVSARVTTDGYARVTAVHVIAHPTFHAKQVVRNIESAMSAGLGISVDRRLISVAQLQEGVTELPAVSEAARVVPSPNSQSAATPLSDTVEAAVAPERPRGRLVFMSYDARSQPNHETLCRVTVRQDKDEFTGTATGGSTPLGRAQAAARALFSAITEGREADDFALDDAAIVSSMGRSFVLVAAHARDGRNLLPLTGVAQLTHAPEQAAILAALQAVNRWNGLED